MKRAILISLLFLAICDHGICQSVRIAVIGSSTAAGTGASSPSNSWVGRLQAYCRRNMLDGIDTIVTNLGVPGYTTYRGQPNGFTPPAGRPAPDTEKNISKALEGSPAFLFVNYPTNDVASAYSQEETIANYERILNQTSSNTRVFFLTPQPRTEFNSSQDAQLVEQKSRMETRFAGMTINVFDPLRYSTAPNTSEQYDIAPQYRFSGDPIHINDEGHNLIFNQVVSAAFAIVLPTKLKSFRAVFNNDRVEIYWETLTELNSKKFVVERSVDGTNFSPVGERAAKGNSTSLARYSFEDRFPLNQKMIYRLRMVDKDGSFRLSTNVVVDRTAAGIENIYPIPASSALNIQLMTLSREYMKIDVLDLNGRELGHFHKSLEKGRQTVSIPVSNLPRGHYMVKIHRANSTSAHPFMKQ